MRKGYSIGRGNIGYVTESSGSVVIADGGKIKHGLAGAPTSLSLVGSRAGDILSVADVDGTNITVAIKRADGSGDTVPQTVYWRAALGPGN